MRRLLVLFMLLFAGVIGVQAQEATEPAALPEGVAERALTIDLGANFVTQAALTFPAEGEGPFPTVILFHGSGPFDMDAAYSSMPGSEILSSNFKLLAERLAAEGYAVLRFNKRGVNGLNDYDGLQIQISTLDQLTDDAHAVIAAAREQEEVDANALYLYGWSEGAWVASNAAVEDGEIAGVILQGAAQGSIEHVLVYQWQEEALTYLAETTDADANGLLTIEEIQTIPVGPISYMAAFFLYDQTSTPARPRINSFVDSNGNQAIAIDGELKPILDEYLANFSQYMPTLERSSDTAALLTAFDGPALVLHGENDGWVPLADGEAIAEATGADIEVFPGLGHSLSLTENPAEDAFLPMDDSAIEALVAWLDGQTE